MNTIFKGSAVALITPFDSNGNIDYNAIENLINFQIDNGTSAIVIIGTTGEPSTLTDDEERELVKFAIQKINKRVPAIVGAGSNSTATAISNAQYAQSVGADALLVVTPYYNKATQNGLINYYKAISDNVNLPIIVYNIKARTGINIEVSTMIEIVKIKNVVALKEASGDINQINAMLHYLKDEIAIYSGDDSLTLPMLAMGAHGVISVAANIVPRQMSDLVALAHNGEFCKANALNNSLYDIFKDIFIEVNPIPVKHALNYMGLNAGLPRAPLTELEQKHKEVLENTLNKFFKK